MIQDNPTFKQSENQQVSPLLFNKIFNDVNTSAEEKTRLLAEASRACRLFFFGLYDKASVDVQTEMLRDYCEAMLCLATKYETIVCAAGRAEGGFGK